MEDNSKTFNKLKKKKSGNFSIFQENLKAALHRSLHMLNALKRLFLLSQLEC